jgi:hypothetical protein
MVSEAALTFAIRSDRSRAPVADTTAAHAIVEAIRFGKDDVERDRRRPAIAQARDEACDHIAPPRPLPDRRQAPLVDIDNDDAIAGRPGDGGSHHAVVHGIVEAREKCGTVHGEDRRDEDRKDAAQKHQPTTRRANALRSHRAPVTGR